MRQKTNITRIVGLLYFLLSVWLFASCEEMEDVNLFCETTFRIEMSEGERVPVKIEINTAASYIRNYGTDENFLNVTAEKPFIIEGASFTLHVLKGYYIAAMTGTVYYADGGKATITCSGNDPSSGRSIKHDLRAYRAETVLTFKTN